MSPMARGSNHSSTVILGLLGLASAAFVSSYSLGANNLAGLRGIAIRPYGDFTIDPGESLLMTVEGDYATYTVPVRGAWRITGGEQYGWLTERCDASKNCEFQAGDYGGEVKIYVDANGMSDEATIYIREPKPPKPVENPFSDSIPDWAGEPIVELKERSIIRGYDDGRYGAGDLLTRGQLITIFHRALVNLNLLDPVNCKQVYKDVPAGHYAFSAACAFRQNAWTDSLSTLSPDEPVTRGETASLLNRVIGKAFLDVKNMSLAEVVNSGQIFSDVPTNHQYFVDTAVTRAIGIMKGNPDRTFGPGKTLNRAEAATIFFRVMDSVEELRVQGI